MAESSWKRKIVGHLAWALDVVPVKRAQDNASRGTGRITMKRKTDGSDIRVQGQGTFFTKELKLNDKIRPPGTAVAFKVTAIESDTVLTVDGSVISTSFADDSPVAFDILKYVDTKVVFGKVIDKLVEGGAVGIFPEGGSHDRTDLLPLKVGVALVAYSALEKEGLNIPIVPVGLNYFRAHRWRGRVVVEYGQPILIDPSTLPAYKAGGVGVSAGRVILV
jgi:glycerol-3-phosphate O-acyltransferase/dihydroxyacetone phosphate acyltransferase